ncbi:hypothetical protein [Allomuricauda sp. SCSIO 65647]|uniref:hypothetical protein n=1 Tax=Allomuricauda sp. SCSIO 65647 TaxID=2908843 RepID=UPI001F44FA26|nr:hypothetical protein [Muricauda sp. SCSIO 65647]UJH68750.1 hypothetical protein L0P89_05925 [Muricauda sp. SCSIO 65647]
MKALKIMTALTVVLMSITNLTAQNNPLAGKWEAEYEENNEKSYVTYEFRKENGKLTCYTTYIKDDKGHGEKHESLAIKDVTFEGGKGTGTFIFAHEGKNYEVRAKLKLSDGNTLTISYSAWGYSDSETWKRLK